MKVLEKDPHGPGGGVSPAGGTPAGRCALLFDRALESVIGNLRRLKGA
ncbi:hypothetical protein P4114_00855 [Pseudomonas aeruginosa]|nr:hypothetical protein [Pseudomonas aeruginosa]